MVNQMEIKLLPIALVILILLGGFASYLNTQQIVYASRDNINKIAVAQTIIDKISRRIDYILSLAEKYNIEIPENLTDNIDLAKELLTNASAIVYDEPCKAIKLAIKASIVFAPVARYVASNLPEEVKSDLERRRVEYAVEARLRMVRKLKLVIERLENMSLPVPEAAVNAVDEAEAILSNALEKIEPPDAPVENSHHADGHVRRHQGHTTEHDDHQGKHEHQPHQQVGQTRGQISRHAGTDGQGQHGSENHKGASAEGGQKKSKRPVLKHVPFVGTHVRHSHDQFVHIGRHKASFCYRSEQQHHSPARGPAQL